MMQVTGLCLILFFEAVEASVKAYYLAGKISKEDLNCIFRKYGIA